MRKAVKNLGLLVLICSILGVINAVSLAAPIKWNPKLMASPEVWVNGQVAGEGSIEIGTDGGNLTVKLEANYGYARLENVLVPANAVKVRVKIIDVSAGQSEGARNLWRLRMVKDDGTTQNAAGGSEAIPGKIDEADIPDDYLSIIQEGLPITLEIGGAWCFGESVVFGLEFLDAQDVSCSY